MIRKRSLLVAIVAAGVSLGCYAENNALSLNMKDGSSSVVAIDNISSITVKNGSVVISKADGSTGNVKISLLRNITLCDMAGVDNITAKSSEISGLVEVYDTYGRLIKTETIAEGSTVDLDGMANGIYIIKSGNKTLKIRKQ